MVLKIQIQFKVEFAVGDSQTYINLLSFLPQINTLILKHLKTSLFSGVRAIMHHSKFNETWKESSQVKTDTPVPRIHR